MHRMAGGSTTEICEKGRTVEEGGGAEGAQEPLKYHIELIVYSVPDPWRKREQFQFLDESGVPPDQ